MSISKTFRTTALATLLAVAGGAQAAAVSGHFNANGFDVIGFTVGAPVTVDMLFTGGYYDATLSLFNGAGAHIVTDDDTNSSLDPHITLNLGSGFYQLMVSYCCGSYSHASAQGALYSSTDGTNSGSYQLGGAATLSSMSAYIASTSGQGVGVQPYTVNISNVTLGGGTVPEPGTLALLGAALVGLQLTRKRQAA